MTGGVLAVGGFAGLFALMLLRVPIGIAMAVVGVGGFAAVVGIDPALGLLAQSPLRTVTSYDLMLVPMFVLMGNFATASGLSRELYDAGHAWFGHRRGGIAMATIAASAGFAAICGSSVASAATMTRVALPEMRRYGYRESVATGTVAAGGTLGILIPPSVVLAVYGILTEQDIGRLFVAGVLPGLLAIVFYMIVVAVLARLRPDDLPAGEVSDWPARWRSLRGIWAVALLFLLVMGGMYAGVFAPSEAAAMGAAGTLIVGVLRRRLDGARILSCLQEAVRTSASIFLILIGALLFGYFLAITRAPQAVVEALAQLPLGPYGILACMLLAYVALGCVLDTLAMIVLTVPITFPVAMHLGFDPIWFGVIVVMTIEIGLISPPIGMNVFVIKSVAPDTRLTTIYRGALPFLGIDVVRLAILCAVPGIVLFLPQSMG